ncbi:MAG: hypothetical protein AAFN30_03405 [Actinomycetota bacterium]
MSNLVRRSGRALARFVGLGLFLGGSALVVTTLMDRTPGPTTTPMVDLTDHLVVADGPLDPARNGPAAGDGVLAFADANGAPGDGPLHLDDIERAEPPVDGLGDDPVLDRWWHECAAGSGYACDRLFADAPSGSAYEEFGLTCGERADVLHCQAELDGREAGPLVDGWPLPFASGTSATP